MRLKPYILEIASTAKLRQIAEDFEIAVEDKRKRQSLLEAISSARRCQPESLFSYLGESEVKQVCETVGIDTKGRKKELIQRLLDGDAAQPKAPTRTREIRTTTSKHFRERTIMSDKPVKQAKLQLATTDAGVVNVEKYEFEPIKGYPMLNWRGKRPFTSTQYYPAQLKEVHGEEVDGWRNKIFWGDNLQVMSHLLRQYRGKVDLIYVDPPFDSKAEYNKTIELRGNKATGSYGGFEEKQYSDIWTNDEYLQFMYERIVMAKELLKDSGSIYLHCDWHKSHHLRCILDEVFGESNHCNEIIRKYSVGGKSKDLFAKKHDTIFFYAKNIAQVFFDADSVRVEFTPHKQDKTGKNYGGRMGVDESGRPYVEKWGTGNKKLYRYYLDEGKIPESVWEFDGDVEFDDAIDNFHRVLSMAIGAGILEDDVWDSQTIQSAAKERTAYPTQKPESLLERIISACAPQGGLVLDFFMGSGTTQAVAMKLGRRFIGADINMGAIQTTIRRLVEIQEDLRQQKLNQKQVQYTGFEVYNVNNYDLFRNPAQAKDLLLEALEVQKLEMSSVFDGEKDGRMVKIMPVNRIATRADLNELIAGFDYKTWERRQADNPHRAVEKVTLVCMGHEPDLHAQLEYAAQPFKIDVEVVDILRDKADLEFKRDSEAKVVVKKGQLVIERFYPMNLLQKLSLQKETVRDWRELVEGVLIDWNYDGAILQPTVVDLPNENDLVKGTYAVPNDAGTIRVKITDVLSESWEGSVVHG